MLVALAGIVPVLIMRGVFLNSYEKCAVRVRTAEIQNQCTILSNQLSSSEYLTGDTVSYTHLTLPTKLEV